MKKKLLNAFKYYSANVILIWIAIALYRYNPYYINFLRAESQQILLYLALGYTALAYPFHLLNANTPSKGHIVYNLFKRTTKSFIHYLGHFTKKHAALPSLEKHEKTTLLFLLVKIFFLPIMINFCINNYFAIQRYLPALFEHNIINQAHFLYIIFPFALIGIFLIDTLWFSFGYTFEAGFLKNKIRSVEPTVFGWVVALASYPPFNGLITTYVAWYPTDYPVLESLDATVVLRMSILILLAIYLWATLALGTKCSNLTNRGIVTKGPYAFIRHPAYICKNIAWWLTLIPIMSIPVFFSMLFWSAIYFFRAITEERHLIADPDYQKYCKKVKYRFIPGVW